MNYRIIHKTEYKYHEKVSLCHNIARLTPRSTDKQFCKKTTVKIEPEPDVLNEYEDFFGNKVVYFAIQKPHEKLTVTVTSDIQKNSPGIIEMKLYGNTPWEEVLKQIKEPKPDHFDARQYALESPMISPIPEISLYASQSFYPGRPIFEATQDLMQRIFRDFKFVSGFTTIATPLSTVIAERKGVCQDFAHLAIACVRSVGLPARYISGYIETIPPPGKEKLTGVDASHAWFSVFIPNVGWTDFDPTNNQLPGDQYITNGWGRDYSDITPLKGVILSSGDHELSVSVDVRRVNY